MDDANLKQTGLKLDHLQEFFGFLPRFWRNLYVPFLIKLMGGGFWRLPCLESNWNLISAFIA